MTERLRPRPRPEQTVKVQTAAQLSELLHGHSQGTKRFEMDIHGRVKLEPRTPKTTP